MGTTGVPELWSFNFTGSTTALGGGVVTVTGNQGTPVWAHMSGPDYGQTFTPAASTGLDMGSVTGGTWDQIVDEDLRIELSLDAALTTTFDFNAIGIETNDWGTCCKGNNTNADNIFTAGTAAYIVFDPTANPSGSSNSGILLIRNLDNTTNCTGGLPSDPETFAGLMADGVTLNWASGGRTTTLSLRSTTPPSSTMSPSHRTALVRCSDLAGSCILAGSR